MLTSRMKISPDPVDFCLFFCRFQTAVGEKCIDNPAGTMCQLTAHFTHCCKQVSCNMPLLISSSHDWSKV